MEVCAIAQQRKEKSHGRRDDGYMRPLPQPGVLVAFAPAGAGDPRTTRRTECNVSASPHARCKRLQSQRRKSVFLRCWAHS